MPAKVKWLSVEDDYLIAKFAAYGVKHCAQKLGRSREAVLTRARRLELDTQQQSRGMSQTPAWLQKAVADFCRGTNSETPAEAIAKGQRTMAEWCDFLETRRVRG